MVTVDLTPGDHPIKMSLDGYNLFEGVINVTATGIITCVSIVDGTCNSITAPGMIINGAVVSGYLKEYTIPTPPVPTDICTWITNAGGWNNLNWTTNVLYAYYEYIGMIGYDVEYSPISWNSVLGLYYYYIGLKAEGNVKTGCVF